MTHRNKEFASPSILHDLSDSTDDSYGNFKKHLSPNGGSFDNDSTKNSQNRKRKNVVPLSSVRSKPKKLFSRIPSNVPRLRRSRIDQFCSELQKGSEEGPESSHSCLEYSPSHVTTRSKQNNTSAGTLIDTSKTGKKNDKSNNKIAQRQLKNGKNTKVNESEVQFEESVHALSDIAVDLFLQKFDQEMARDSVKNKVVEKEESFTSNEIQKSKTSKVQSRSKAYNLPSQTKRKNRKVSDSSETDSISSVTSNTSRYGRVRKTPSVYVQATMFQGANKKPDELKQKASSFVNSHRCQNRTLSTFSKSSSIDETGNQKSIQSESLTPPLNKNTCLKQSVHLVTPTKSGNSKIRPNGLIALRSPNRNFTETSFHELETEHSDSECDNFVVKTNDCENLFKKPTSFPSCSRSDGNASKCTRKYRNMETEKIYNDSVPEANDPENVFKKPRDISRSGRSESTLSNFERSPVMVLENVLLDSSSPGKPVKLVKPSLQRDVERDGSMAGSFYSSVSQTTFQAVNDDFGGNFVGYRRKPDQSKLHAVVNDDVISLKWFAPPPNLDAELSNGTNMHCSLPDFKQFFSTSSAGYLKIEAGGENSMQILKKCYMFYKVEKGEAVVRLPERTRVAQVGSMFFIPQGAEYTIRNSSVEEDLILLFVKMSPPT